MNTMNITVTHTLILSDDAKEFLSELFGKKAVTSAFPAPTPSPSEPIYEAEPEAPATPKKVVPPGISCTRIGQDTAAAIMKLLPAPIEVIEKSIKRNRVDAEALLKLLWERNKLGYDGEVYHELS